MINNLAPKQLEDIHYLFNYFSGRKTTLESELKQAGTVDLTTRLSPDSEPDQHLLMKAYCEYSQQFVGHGFFYIPIEERDMDEVLNLAFAGLHPQRYIPDFNVKDDNNEAPKDLLSRIQEHVGTLVKNLDGTRDTIKLNNSPLVISYKKVREMTTGGPSEESDEETYGRNDGEYVGDVLSCQRYMLGGKLDLKDREGYHFRLGISVEALPNPPPPKSNLGEIEDAVQEHLSGLVKFTYAQSGLLEEFPVLKAYVRGDDQVTEISVRVNLNWRKIIPDSDEKLHCAVNFGNPCLGFQLFELESRFGGGLVPRSKKSTETQTEPIPISFLFDLCCRAYLQLAKSNEGMNKAMEKSASSQNRLEELGLFGVLPLVVCNQVENLFRDAYPKEIARQKQEAETERDDRAKVMAYFRLASLQALSDLDQAYETLAKAVRWDKKHGKHFEFDDWNGGVKTIR